MTSLTRPFRGAYSMGTSQRTPLAKRDEVPGPGQYNIKEDYVFQRLATFKFPSATRNFTSKSSKNKNFNNEVYDIIKPATINNGPKFSLGKKIDQKLQAFDLGPGSYNPRILKSQKYNYSFGYKFDENPDQREAAIKPGPGNYTMPDTTFIGKIKKAQKRLSKLEQSSNSTLNQEKFEEKQQKFQLLQDRKLLMPGPGYYNPQINQFAPSPSFKFPITEKSQRPKNTTGFQSPVGPGYYYSNEEEDESQKVIKGFSLLGKNNINFNNTKVPGPGTYNPQLLDLTKKYKFSLSKKNMSVDLSIPGPQHYMPKDIIIHNRSISFGTSQRTPLENTTMKTPGAGQYDILKPQNGGPNIKILGSKSQKEFSQNIPGPGKYLGQEVPKNYRQAPKVQIGIKLPSYNQDKNKYNQPGPGYYDSSYRVSDGPSFSFGNKKSLGFKSKYDILPGPGAYEIMENVASMPSYMINKKNQSINASQIGISVLKELDDQLMTH